MTPDHFRKSHNMNFSGGGQCLERPNVEPPIIRDFEISNIKIRKVKLFDFSIFEFFYYFYHCLNYSNTQNYVWVFTIKFEIFGILIDLQIVKFLKFANFWNSIISEIWFFYEYSDNGNLMIFEIVKVENFCNIFFNLKNQNLIPTIGKFWFCSSIRYFVLFGISPVILIFDLWNSKSHRQKILI